MADLIEHADGGTSEVAHERTSRRPVGPRHHLGLVMRTRRAVVVAISLVLMVGAFGAVALTTEEPTGASPSSQAPITTVSMATPRYTPKAPVGGTDDYHCTLVNPHITRNSYVISSHFTPGSREVHHAVFSLVPPSMNTQAMAANAATDGKGWTCFGAPALPGGSLAAFFSTPFLAGWGPGHGKDVLPKGTGIPFPKGTLVIEQVHYNLLVGDKPVTNRLVLHTVPASTPLLPMQSQYFIAPPNIPCPAGVTGPLCNYQASLNYLAQRFGPMGPLSAKGVDELCGENPNDPPVGDTATCTQQVASAGYIDRIAPHMHLLGISFKMVLNPGTPQAKTILNVPDYDFNYQRAYNITPVPVTRGEPVQITCTYNPELAEELPILRKAPPHFVTFGDGSSDEMCTAVTWQTKSLPNLHDSF